MDRWVEIDIDWFGAPPWTDKLATFVERTRPLFQGADGLRGICFNIGWLADLVTEWTGTSSQPLPLRSRRFATWAALSYDDLRRFLAELRAAEAGAGIADIKLGVLIAGLGQVVAPPVTGAMYDLFSNWHDRHPELYPLDISPLPGPDLDPRVAMVADTYPYATRPAGIVAGDPFPEFFGAQWGSVATFLGLDLIHLRDGMLGPLLYTRVGPYGTTASADPDENRTWTDAVRRLFRACKEAHPSGLVMAYSSGLSGTAEWLAGCVDLEAIVADGALDIFIDQTWGGAWQDWWDDTWKGWTFQLAYLLGHGAQIRGGNAQRSVPCKQYKLIETWDGWEPWDTLHDTPGKLGWAMWAFSHAAVLAEDGRPVVPEGTYISWLNDWNDRLIEPADVAFLVDNLDAAEASANSIETVYGPLLVHDRPALLAKYEAEPEANASEWIEDYVGMAMKWATPVLAATRSEWLPASWPDGAFLQLPASSPNGGETGGTAAFGGPLLSVGRADLIEPGLLAGSGVAEVGEQLSAGYRLGYPASPDLRREDRLHLPDRRAVMAADGATVGYDSRGMPLLVSHDQLGWWQPPDLADPGNALIPHSQIGSVSPYIEAGRFMAAGAGRSGGFRTEPVASHEPVAVHAWRSGGALYVLLGNLESGWMGDARFVRRVTVILPRERCGLDADTAYVLRGVNAGVNDGALVAPDPGSPADELRFTISVDPEWFRVLRLEHRAGGQA